MTPVEMVDVKHAVMSSMQNTLSSLATECTLVRMSPNSRKCEVMIISPSNRSILCPQVTLSNWKLPVIQKCKLLGLYIIQELNWKDHVDHLTRKSNKCMFIQITSVRFQQGGNTNIVYMVHSSNITICSPSVTPCPDPNTT